MQFRPSNALIFQSRTTLDAILTLERSHFSIKNKNGLNCPSSIAHKHPLSSHPTVPYFSYTTFLRLDNSRYIKEWQNKLVRMRTRMKSSYIYISSDTL